jgi:hypothetical protein
MTCPAVDWLNQVYLEPCSDPNVDRPVAADTVQSGLQMGRPFALQQRGGSCCGWVSGAGMNPTIWRQARQLLDHLIGAGED